jgi:hypothetical protein
VPRVKVLANPSRLDAGAEQRIVLQVQNLTAVALGYPHVADQQHGVVDAAR